MECNKCKKKGELMPKRSICRKCYNAQKLAQKKKRNLQEKEGECTKCFQTKTLCKGKNWCKECKNEYERLRRQKNRAAINEKERKKYHEKKNIVKELKVDNTKSKVCTKCKEEKTLDNFHVHKGKGTIRAACKTCDSKARSEYYKNNRTKLNKQTTQYQNNRCKVDPNYKLSRRLRSRLWQAITNQRGQKSNRTMVLVGCTIPFLRGYLEARFKEGMTWENYGTWHIDHIQPCASFDLTKKENQVKCFHYTNLQPLWASENLSKGDELLSDEKLKELSNLYELSEQELENKKQQQLIEEKKLIEILPKDKKICKKKHNQNLPKYIYYRESHGGKYKGYVVEHPNGTKRFGKKIFTLEENLHKAKVYLATLITKKKGKKEVPSV